MLFKGVVSGWEMVRSGVPQGSGLGPVLFVICIDYIDENIRSTVFKFVDDTKVVARVGMKEDMKEDRREYGIGWKVRVSHTSERDLGVIVQSNLKVDMQCNKAACEASRRLGMIKRNLDSSQEVSCCLYISG